jgi:glycosyltransferase involved in cell wall biosynthesis
MRVLQVTNGFPPSANAGVEQYTHQLTKHLVSRHEVQVFCRESNPSQPDYEVIDNRYDGLSVRRVVNDFKHARQIPDFYLDRRVESIFRETVTQWHPDLIHFQHCIGLSASLLDVANGARVPYLLTLHDYWFICSRVQLLHRRGYICPGPVAHVDCYDCHMVQAGLLGVIRGTQTYGFLRTHLSDDTKRWMLRTLSRLTSRVPPPVVNRPLSPFLERDKYMLSLLKATPLILVPSDFVKDLYVSHGVPKERVVVLPLGLDLDRWRHDESAKSHCERGLRVGYFGTLLRHKGVHVLIRAFHRLNHRDASLRIYGFSVPGDPYIDELRTLAGKDKRVQLMGGYTPQDLPALLKAVDVMVIPSLWHETFSIVAREALLSGTPVIASQVGALPEVVRHGENGLLVTKGDVDALYSALSDLDADPGLLSRLHQGALISATNIKSIEAHVDDMERVYESLVSTATLIGA